MKKNTIIFVIFSFILSLFLVNINAEDEYEIDNFSDYNVILTGDHSAEQADTEGAIAVKGDLDAPTIDNSSFSVGAGNDDYSSGVHIGESFDPDKSPALLIGGTIGDVSDTSVLSVLGNSVGIGNYDPTNSISTTYNLDSISQSELDDIFSKFETIINGFIDLANDLDVGEPMGNGAGSNSGTQFTFNNVNAQPTISYAQIDGDTVNISEYNITTEVAQSDLIVYYSDAEIVNFSDGAALYNGSVIDTNALFTEGNLMSTLATKSVFIFPNATEVNIDNYGVIGSVFAPNATINGEGGAINGQIYATNLNQAGGFEAHNFILDVDTVGEVTVNKVDESNNSLSGAEIGLYDMDDKLIDSKITDENGQVTFTNVPLGYYYIKEIEAPEGYELSDKKIDVVITPFANSYTFELVNKADTGSVAVIKTDSADAKPMEGVTFDIYDSNSTKVGSITTDENGYASISGLTYGEYTAVEVVPDGYNEDNNVYHFTVDEDSKFITYSIENERYGSVEICKEDGYTNEKLAGAEFTLTHINNNYSDTKETDETGCLSFDNLEYGVYKIEETKAPEHENSELKYVNEGWTKYLVIGDVQQEYSYTVQNFADKGYAKLLKVDGDTNNPLEGVEFDLYSKDDNFLGTYTTDSNGEIVFGPLDYGEYYIVESSPLPGYETNDERYYFEISKQEQEVSFTLANYQEVVDQNADISVLKTDENGEALSGAEIGLYNNNDKLISSAVTDENGYVYFTDIENGVYYLQEIKAPDGYIISDEKKYVTVSSLSNEYTYTLVNEEASGYIEIYKENYFGDALEGATFEIYEVGDDSNVVETITTDSNGYAYVELPYGEYYMIETEAPEGYLEIEDEIYFSISSEQSSYSFSLVDKVDIESVLNGRLAILKVDSETQESLEGVEFTITDDENEVVDVITTGPNGIAISKELPYGKYTITETKPLDGYQDEEISFEVVVDESFKGQLISLENSKAVGDVELEKVDSNDQPLAGAEFTIYADDNLNEIYDENDTKIASTVTDEDGYAHFNDLEYGQYIIKETNAPDGYYVTDEEIVVIIDESSDYVYFEIENRQELGFIQINKEDDKGNSLAGVTFAIQGVSDPSFYQEVTTAESGQASAILPLGDYQLIEISAPEGYVIDDTIREFSITDNYQLITFDIVNELEDNYGYAEITKKDQYGNLIADNEFCVYEQNPDQVEDADLVDCGETDENGVYQVGPLEYGTYYLKESHALYNYYYNPEVIEFEISDDEITSTFDFINQLYDPSITIYKVDEDSGVYLDDAEFEVYKDSDNDQELTDADELVVDDLVTVDGEVSFEFASDFEMFNEDGSLVGYFIKETKAPEGYKLPKDELYVTFGFTEDGKTILNPDEEDIQPPIYLVEPSEQTVFEIEIENEEEGGLISQTGFKYNFIFISLLIIVIFALYRYNHIN